MPERKETADRLAAYSDAVFTMIGTIMILELKAPEQAAFFNLWPLWPTAISYAVSYLFIAIIWINHLLHAVRRYSGAGIDMDQLHTSVPGVTVTVCDLVDCAGPARIVPYGLLSGALCLH